MRYFIIAGEASGDLHASGLARELAIVDPDADIEGWGGDNMAEAGVNILKHYRELAFMGFVEVAMNIRTILGNFKLVKAQIKQQSPDVLVLVDYPGFNLRMAKWAHAEGIPVHYYISPQLWAWKEGRVKQIREYVDKMYVILPFEKGFYQKHGIDVTYVGHPLLEAIQRYRTANPAELSRSGVAILAGSRRQEISHILPVMIEAAKTFPDRQFTIAAAPSIPEEFYRKFLDKEETSNIDIVFGDTYGVLLRSKAAMTTSGTATLETALFGVPQVVCYKGNQLSFEIAKRLVKVPYISLVNLILGKPVVEELIQDNVNPMKLSNSLQAVISGEIRDMILSEYDKLEDILDEGGASKQVAASIYSSIKT